jgi:hypothetical protein
MLTVDFIAKRYGKLPSEIMASATTFDMTVGQTAVEYENYCYEREKRKANGVAEPAQKLTQEQMLEMMRVAKEQANVSKHKS